MMRGHVAAEGALPDEIKPGDGNPGALLVAYGDRSIRTDTETIGVPEAGGEELEFLPIT